MLRSFESFPWDKSLSFVYLIKDIGKLSAISVTYVYYRFPFYYLLVPYVIIQWVTVYMAIMPSIVPLQECRVPIRFSLLIE